MFLPLLLEQGSGHIVNTASTAGLLPYGFDRLPYTATKHAIVGLSESLALYLRPKGIGVSCLCPAGVATNILEQITFYGEPAPPRGPDFADPRPRRGRRARRRRRPEGRFLILTAPDAAAELREHGADIDAYLARRIRPTPRLVTRVGFIGLGSQGAPMARRIVDEGHALTIWARRADVEPFADSAAAVAATPAELGAASDVVGVCVVADADVEDVLLRDDGVLAGMAPAGS